MNSTVSIIQAQPLLVTEETLTLYPLSSIVAAAAAAAATTIPTKVV
jgi:hypothetical protein